MRALVPRLLLAAAVLGTATSWPRHVKAQSHHAVPRASVSLSAVTVHALGVGAEVRLLDRLALVGRGEGFVGRRKRAAGLGLRADVIETPGFALGAIGLAGATSCRRRGESFCDGGEKTAFAMSGVVAVEFKIGARWSNALEVGYWRPVVNADEEDTDYGSPRFTLGMTVRYVVLAR